MGEKEFSNFSKVKLIVGWLGGEELLTVKEAAELLRIKPDSANKVIKREGVKSRLIGKRRLFKRTDIEQLMNRLERRRVGKE